MKWLEKQIMDNFEQQIKYSVLMSVYAKDKAEWFMIAVKSMMDQTMRPSEIVIVEDGELTPELYKTIDEICANEIIPIVVVKLECNKGLGEALRVGVLNCQYDWIARMDADDFSVPQRCQIQFKAQKENDADIIGCNVIEFIDTFDNVVSKRIFPESHDQIINFAKKRTPFPHPGVLMRKDKVIEAGNYRSAYLHEDYDLFVRMLMKGGKGYNAKEFLVYMRVNNFFYKRRGGIKYLKVLLRFNKYLRKIGWMSFKDYCVRSFANIVSCLMPTCVRRFIYKHFLRK